MGETIVLPKSGVVLRQVQGRVEWRSAYGIATVDQESGTMLFRGKCGDLFVQAVLIDHCIERIDDRVIELRAALTPPGHVLVGPDARETVARELWEFNRVCEWTEATEDEKTDYLLGADAVLRAIGVRGGA